MKPLPRWLILAVLLLCGLSFAGSSASETATGRIAAIEKRIGGRLGVAALETDAKRRIEHRAEERFAMCSTFKLSLAAAILARVDAGRETLQRLISYSEADLLEYAPVTKAHLSEGGMTVEALCVATIQYSDNTAANLLLATLGGPNELTTYFRKWGDTTSRLDRNEPTLNDVPPGEVRDTTSPTAMLGTLQKLLLGDALTGESRKKLEDWLAGNTTGGRLIRAGVPAGWRVGDKTGRGGANSINDIAIVRPPKGAPILLCIYLTESPASVEEREAAISETARIVVEEFR